MKKSYHSTVVPTTVAKTTRLRSTGLEIVPVGVKPAADWGEWDCGVTIVVTPEVSTLLGEGGVRCSKLLPFEI